MERRPSTSAYGTPLGRDPRHEGSARFRLDLKEKGLLTKGPQDWKFARAYVGAVGTSEKAAMEQLFIPRPDIKRGGRGRTRRKAPEGATG